jgi:hypothetical protein
MFLAGQVSYDKDGGVNHVGDFKGQARQVFGAIKALVQAGRGDGSRAHRSFRTRRLAPAVNGLRVERAGRATSRAGAAPVSAAMRAGLWLLFAAHVVTGWGTQWDIRWHLRVGRDSFWIPPHLMTYSGVTAIVLISFGVLAWTTSRALRGDRTPGTIDVVGVTGTPGYHLAAWGIALTALAAPIDDLWHRLFGLDVTLWSPPHLLGLGGGLLNAAACWVIAQEIYPAGSRARHVAILLAGAFVYAGFGLAVQPAIRIGFIHGGLAFFLYPMLAALLLPLALAVTARLSGLRAAPLLAVAVVVLIGIAGAVVSHVGFAWTQPVSFLAEEIAKDPTSPIAMAHEIARRNGTSPGALNPGLLGTTLLAALVMAVVDARRRPLLAALAYGLTLLAVVSLLLARTPAFAQSLPSAVDTAAALAVTALAGLASGAMARRIAVAGS